MSHTPSTTVLETALLVTLEQAIRGLVRLLPLIGLLTPSLRYADKRRLLRSLDRLQSAHQEAENQLSARP